jgi:hypothetical protein
MPDTCSIGRIIDGLTAISTLPEYSTLFADVVVVDGPWPQSNLPAELITIGLTEEGDSESGGVQLPRTMGAGGGFGTISENYGIICEIVVWTGDVDLSAQKTIRDRVHALFAAYEVTIRSNCTLSGLLVPAQSGQPPQVYIESYSYSQVPVSLGGPGEDATFGRRAAMKFTVHVDNSLNF